MGFGEAAADIEAVYLNREEGVLQGVDLH